MPRRFPPGLITRRRAGQILEQAARKTDERINAWRAELQARGNVTDEEDRALFECWRWNMGRLHEAHRLLCPPPISRYLELRPDGWWRSVRGRKWEPVWRGTTE